MDWHIVDGQVTIDSFTLPVRYEEYYEEHDDGTREVPVVECPECGEEMFGWRNMTDVEVVAREAVDHCLLEETA